MYDAIEMRINIRTPCMINFGRRDGVMSQQGYVEEKDKIL